MPAHEFVDDEHSHDNPPYIIPSFAFLTCKNKVKIILEVLVPTVNELFGSDFRRCHQKLFLMRQGSIALIFSLQPQ